MSPIDFKCLLLYTTIQHFRMTPLNKTIRRQAVYVGGSYDLAEAYVTPSKLQLEPYATSSVIFM